MLRLAFADFGFEQESTLSRDDRAGFHPVDNLDTAAAALAGNHRHGLEAFGGLDENDLAAFDGLHRFLRQRDQARPGSAARLDPRTQPLAGRQAADAIGDEDNRRRLAFRVEARGCRPNHRIHGLAAQQFDDRGIARADPPRICGEHRGVDLDAAGIGDPEQFGARKHIGPEFRVRLGDPSRNQARHRQRAAVARYLGGGGC